MAAGDSAGRFLDLRPLVTRTRSNSSPITKKDPTDLAPPTRNNARPTHSRSRSYISPIEHKRSSTVTLSGSAASEKASEPSRFRRLHLPGKHHHTLSEEQKPAPHQRRHRHTQSEAQHYRGHERGNYNEGKSPNMAHAPFNQHNSVLYPYAGSRGAPIPSLSRMTSYRSNIAPSGDALFYGPVQGDTRLPNQDGTPSSKPPRKKTSLEKLLDQTALPRHSTTASATPSKSDITKLNTQLSHAKSELSTRLSTTSRTASSLMRRLDESNDTLHRTAESLIDTLSSFSNLSQQSSKLLSNFETESSNLDATLRKRIAYFRNHICAKRAERIDELERRGRDISSKAEELGRRLENCRVIVLNWEERERNKRKAWKGVWNGLFWGVLLILVGILAGVASWKAVERGARGKGYMVGDVGSGGNDTMGKGDVLQGSNAPEDVKILLDEIAMGKDIEIDLGIRYDIDPKKMARLDKDLRMLDEL